MNLTKNTTKPLSIQLLYSIIGVFSCIALPQVFHLVGLLTGTGTALGIALSPMHLPVIALGLTVGPIAGAVTGIFAPVLSHAITGMPYLANLPLMVVELAVYGAVSGLIKNAKMPTVIKIVVTQIVGRIAYVCMVALAVYLFKSEQLSVSGSLVSLLGGLPGVILQLASLPLIVTLYDKLSVKD